MNGFIFGFHRFVWCPKCTPASRSSGTNSVVSAIKKSRRRRGTAGDEYAIAPGEWQIQFPSIVISLAMSALRSAPEPSRNRKGDSGSAESPVEDLFHRR